MELGNRAKTRPVDSEARSEATLVYSLVVKLMVMMCFLSGQYVDINSRKSLSSYHEINKGQVSTLRAQSWSCLYSMYVK